MTSAGTASTPDAIPSPRAPLRARALTVVAVLTLVPITTCWLSWNYEKAGFPIKPRDFTLGMGALMIVLIAWNRPRFCLPALLPLPFLLARLFDAAILERYSVVSLGTHQFYVMIMLANFLVTVLFLLTPAAERGMDTVRWLATAIIVGCAAANLYEYLGFASFTRITGRMSGYLEDPNHSPILICLLLGVLFTVNPNFWWNVAVIAVSAVAIALTLSRSGMAVFAIMALPYLALHFRQRAGGLLLIGAIAIPLAGVGLTVLSQSSRTGVVSNEDVGARLQAIYDLDFEKIKSPERAKDLQDGWEAVSQAVLLGHGTGAGTNKWQPHNQFVSIWLDIGFFGMLSFAALVFGLVLASLRKRLRGFFCLIPVLLFIPCSQVLIEAPVYWFAISIACHVLFPRRIALHLLPRSQQRTPLSPPTLSAAVR